MPIEKIEFSIGGGGTNTAFTFKNQGLTVAWCGAIGDDISGNEVKSELKKKGISTDFIFLKKQRHTNYSVILSTKKERTILVYKGASGELREKDIPWQKLKAKWFYLAPLSGKVASVFEPILNFAKSQAIKIAINPGNIQLSLPKTKLKKLLNFADILILNQEEASLATNLPYSKEKEIFKTLDDWVGGIIVMTKGPLGGIVSDGDWLYEYGILKTKKLVDRTGVGDAFGSGFTTSIIRSYHLKSKNYRLTPKNIEQAIQFGSANATSCLLKPGAKNGLLKKGEPILKWGRVKIKKIKI
jgi:sugar/nucleoside kinase (ribokinase family)